MPLLWKYPCGCVGLGKPHAPRMEDRTQTWDDVIVVRVCDSGRWMDDEGWLMPAPRLLASPFGEAPQGLEEHEEEEYFAWMCSQRRNAINWVRTKTVVRTLMEVSDEQ